VDFALIADTSMAIVYFNIARLAAATKEPGETEEYLKKAKALAPGLIRKRLELDHSAWLLLQQEVPRSAGDT
ncbi:MAG: hypothetical protein C0390_06335, partial [Syntrophus sp. (in: bacteria)]|nr:hypothetical protein [Syntrophus sp. (in: bacteria)]